MPGQKGDFFARSEGIGCIWKALVTFLGDFLNNEPFKESESEESEEMIIYIYIYIFYLIYHISYMYCL